MYNECRHIFTSGRKGQSPALKDLDFCYFHHKSRKRPSPANQAYEPYTEPKETTLSLSPLEDADAIQLAISDVVLALAANRIDSRRARILICGLQVASQNNRHRAAWPRKKQPSSKRSAKPTSTKTDRSSARKNRAPNRKKPQPESVLPASARSSSNKLKN